MTKLYSKQTWTDEVLAGAERYDILEDDGTPIYEDAQIALATAVTQAGTAVDATRLQHIEDGLDAVDTRANDLFTEVTNGRGGKTDLDARFDDIESEISTARGGQANLDARLDGYDAHQAQHAWLAAQEVDIKDNWLDRVYPFVKVFDNLDGWTTGHVGSGAFTPGWPIAVANTGATNNSKVVVYSGGIYVYTSLSPYYTRFKIRVHSTTATINENFTCRLGLLTNPAAPTDVEKHIAFGISAGNIYARCGDGTDATVEDTGVDFAQYSSVHLHFRQNGSTVYFYVNSVLTNTISTHVPTGALIYPAIYMTNSAAVAKALNVYPMMIVQGP